MEPCSDACHKEEVVSRAADGRHLENDIRFFFFHDAPERTNIGDDARRIRYEIFARFEHRAPVEPFSRARQIRGNLSFGGFPLFHKRLRTFHHRAALRIAYLAIRISDADAMLEDLPPGNTIEVSALHQYELTVTQIWDDGRDMCPIFASIYLEAAAWRETDDEVIRSHEE